MRRTRLALALLAASLVAACSPAVPAPDAQLGGPASSSEQIVPLPPGASIEQPGAQPPGEPHTGRIEGTYRPRAGTPKDRIPEIVSRGYIIVGVDQSQNLMSYRNPATGQLEGFEVDMAREIARDIFGDPDKVDFRYVDSADRVRSLSAGEVDIVVRTLSITPERQQEVLFSAPYLSSSTRMLVLDNSPIKGVGDLSGRTVCVTDQSTAIRKARQVARESPLLKVRNWADCLVAIQQHQADAVFSDDVILSGMAAQDPYTKIVGAPMDNEIYGVGVARTTSQFTPSEMVRQVNVTMERIRRDGTWQRLFQRWLSNFEAASVPPPIKYLPPEREEQS